MLEIECYQKLKRDIELHGCIKGHFLENAFQPPPLHIKSTLYIDLICCAWAMLYSWLRPLASPSRGAWLPSLSYLQRSAHLRLL